MKRSRLLLIAALVPAVLLGAVAPTALASGGHENLLAAGMKGANEVPPVSTGDPDAAGYGVVRIDRGHRRVCVEDFAIGGASPLILFHIHRGVAGTNGPIVVDFTSLLPSGIGCVSVTDKDLLKDIERHPQRFYLNAHSTEFPGGAARGQLVTIDT
jgi:hypothetical protein